jgi:hypothetical protein
LTAPGRLGLRVRAEDSLSPDEGVVVDSFEPISFGRSTADFVVALFRLVPSFPPLSDSEPLVLPFLPFTLASPRSPLVIALELIFEVLTTIDSFRLGTPVGGPPGPGSGPI